MVAAGPLRIGEQAAKRLVGDVDKTPEVPPTAVEGPGNRRHLGVHAVVAADRQHVSGPVDPQQAEQLIVVGVRPHQLDGVLLADGELSRSESLDGNDR